MYRYRPSYVHRAATYGNESGDGVNYVPAHGYLPQQRLPGGGMTAYLAPESGQWEPIVGAGIELLGPIIDIAAGGPGERKKTAQAQADAAQAALAQAQIEQQTTLLQLQAARGGGLGGLGGPGPLGIPIWLWLAGGGVAIWFVATQR